MSLRSIAYCLGISFLAVACTDSREQYGRSVEAPLVEKRQGLGQPIFIDTDEDGTVSGDRDGDQDVDLVGPNLSQEEQDRRRRENSRQPIVYGQGASHISFETTILESQNILSRPFFGPDADGFAAYDESIYVDWRTEAPRVPDAIYVNTGYLGELELPTPLRNFRMGMELREFFPPTDPFGLQFLKTLYQVLEGVDSGYDCLLEQTCRAITGEEQYILFRLPRAIFLFSKDDRNTLYRIVLLRYIDPGLFANDFDLLTGRFVMSEETELKIGQPWGAAREASTVDSETETLTRSFRKDFEGVSIGLSRSHFLRDYREPTEDEIFQSVSLFSPGRNRIQVGGQYVVVSSGDGLNIDLAFSSIRPPISTELELPDVLLGWVDEGGEGIERALGEREARRQMVGNLVGLLAPTALQPQMQSLIGRTQLQKDLIQKLSDLLLARLEEQAKDNPQQVIARRVRGFHNDREGRSFSTTLVSYDPVANQGRHYFVSINERDGTMVFATGLFNNQFDPYIVPTLNQPIRAGNFGVSGLRLGDVVQLKDLDVGKGEATVQMLIPSEGELIEVTERVSYSPDGSLVAAYIDGGKLREFPQAIHTIGGVSELTLGLAPLEAINWEGTTRFEVVAISSSSHVQGVENVCGLPEFSLKIGTRDINAVESLQKAIEKAHQQKALALEKVQAILRGEEGSELTDLEWAYAQFQGCNYAIPVDAQGRGLIRRIYIPEQRMSLQFSDREFSGVTVYKRAGEPVAAHPISGGQQENLAVEGGAL